MHDVGEGMGMASNIPIPSLGRDSHFVCNVRLEFVLVETILIEMVDTLRDFFAMD